MTEQVSVWDECPCVPGPTGAQRSLEGPSGEVWLQGPGGVPRGLRGRLARAPRGGSLVLTPLPGPVAPAPREQQVLSKGCRSSWHGLGHALI